MIAFSLLIALACRTPPPPANVVPPPPDDVVNAITIKVPSDCPHLIVDVVTTTQSDITVACFSHVTRTYFFHEEQPLFSPDDESPRESQLTLQYADDPVRLLSVP